MTTPTTPTEHERFTMTSSIKVRERNVRRVWRWVVRTTDGVVVDMHERGLCPESLAMMRAGYRVGRERVHASEAAIYDAQNRIADAMARAAAR